MSECEYEGVRRIQYEGGAIFVPVCETCFRFVTADETIEMSLLETLRNQPNATCSKCGRTKMLFEGYFDEIC